MKRKKDSQQKQETKNFLKLVDLNSSLLEQGKFGRVLGEIFVSPEYVGEHITECIANTDSGIDLSVDGWVSVNDILIEEGHAYDYHGGKKKDFKNEIKEEKAKAKESIKDI